MLIGVLGSSRFLGQKGPAGRRGAAIAAAAREEVGNPTPYGSSRQSRPTLHICRSARRSALGESQILPDGRLRSRGHHVVTECARRGRLLTVVGQQPAKAKFAHGGEMQAVKGSAMPFA